jgi:PIN domain nuclease of toxin-antitoxin system
MKFLLDTAVFVWALREPDKLHARASSALLDETHEFYLSAASVWEIVIKFLLGKLTLPKTPAQLIPEALNNFAFRPLTVTIPHTLAVGELPRHHADPFDRILIAQAKIEDMVLMTADAILKKYPVEILWSGKS